MLHLGLVKNINYTKDIDGGIMKKIICIMLCLLFVVGCSLKKEENSVNDKGTQTEISEKQEQKENEETNKTIYDTYSLYSGVKSESGSWYYDAPYLNKIERGKAVIFANGDNWWIGFGMDLSEETSNLDDAYDLGINAFYSGIRAYFEPAEEGLIIDKKEKTTVLDFEMYKLEGDVQNIKHESGTSSNCWVYGYTFIIGNTPCAMLGMTFEDNSDQAKKDIVMYVDDMVKSLRAE